MKERKKVLVIEDHDSIRLLLGTYLSKSYQVVTMEDGFDALAWLSKGNIPDCILLDIDMPRIDGMEFLTNIRGSGFFRNIPVIVISGKESSEFRAKCREFGVVAFLNKPFNPLKLKEEIKNALQIGSVRTGRASN